MLMSRPTAPKLVKVTVSTTPITTILISTKWPTEAIPVPATAARRRGCGGPEHHEPALNGQHPDKDEGHLKVEDVAQGCQPTQWVETAQA